MLRVSDIHDVTGVGQGRDQRTSNEEARRDRETLIGLRASEVDSKDLGLFLEEPFVRGSSPFLKLKLPSNLT